MQYHDFHAMSTEIVLAAEGKAEITAEGFRKVEDFILTCERRFSSFNNSSELMQLNQAAGSWFPASRDLYEIVSLAFMMYSQTRGLFDPGLAVLGMQERGGHDRTMSEDHSRADNAASGFAAREQPIRKKVPITINNSLPSRPGFHQFGEIRLDPDPISKSGNIWLPPGTQIDLDGIGKGWIAERSARLLANYVKTCAVDAGGDVFMIGLPAGENSWRVALENPSEPHRNLAVLNVGPGAVATSSITKHEGQLPAYQADYSMKPPMQTDWLSVTVIGPHAAQAKVLANTLLIGGKREVDRVAGPAIDIDFIIVDTLGKMWGSSSRSLQYLESSQRG